jgi:hypothetical protein
MEEIDVNLLEITGLSKIKAANVVKLLTERSWSNLNTEDEDVKTRYTSI